MTAFAVPAVALEYTSSGAVTLRTSAAHTTDARIEFVNDGGYCGAYIYIDTTAEVATAIITVTLEIVDTAGTKTEPFLMTAISTVTETIQVIHPVMDSTHAKVTSNILIPLPHRFNIFLDHTDADSMTYTASIQFIKGC